MIGCISTYLLLFLLLVVPVRHVSTREEGSASGQTTTDLNEIWNDEPCTDVSKIWGLTSS